MEKTRVGPTVPLQKLNPNESQGSLGKETEQGKGLIYSEFYIWITQEGHFHEVGMAGQLSSLEHLMRLLLF